jgi:hypothetical protein
MISFKGIVQRDLTGVKTKLKRSVLINFRFADVFFSFERDTTAREVKSQFQRPNNSSIELAGEFTKSCKHQLLYHELRNLAYNS